MALPKLMQDIFENGGVGPNFRKDKLPTIEETDVPATLLRSTAQTLTDAEKTQVLKNLMGTFLPLSGGTLTGNVNLDGKRVLSGNVGMWLHEDYCDFVRYADGKVVKAITFRFSDWPNGWWQGVRSVNGVGAVADGNITLGAGVHLTASYVKSGSVWARKWSNGVIEQAGVCKDNETVTFNYPFTSSTSWFGICTPLAETNYGSVVVDGSRTNTGCKFYLGHLNYYGFYYVSGT